MKTLCSRLNNRTSDQAGLQLHTEYKHDAFYKTIIVYGQPPFESEVLELLYTLGNTGAPEALYNACSEIYVRKSV